MTNKILLGHGSGGKMSHDLIEDIFIKYFGNNNEILTAQTDSAIINVNSAKLAYTTDSYVVDPVFFPGGNIGKLAICGTVNDLAVSGAKPLYISVGFIIEEGFEIENLEEIVKTMSVEAQKADVKIVTGDTKVVNKGKCDKIFINTSGVGELETEKQSISYGTDIKIGDKIIINGDIADHGICVMAAREKLVFENDIKTDCAPLNLLISKVLEVSDNVKFMRDATRGGVATVMVEIAKSNNLGVELYEENIPVKESVRGMCEILGFDPLYVANEGKVIMVVASDDAELIIKTLRKNEFGKEAQIIGEITDTHKGKVVLNTEIGGKRIVDMLAGQQLPRIC